MSKSHIVITAVAIGALVFAILTLGEVLPETVTRLPPGSTPTTSTSTLPASKATSLPPPPVSNSTGTITSTTTSTTANSTSLDSPTILTTFDSSLAHGVLVSASGTSTSSTHWSVPVRDAADQSTMLWRISPSPWAVESSTSGAVSIQYAAQGSVVIRNTLSGITGPFGGYPKIQYGRNPYGDLAAGQPPRFPIQLKNMSELVAGTTYTLTYNKMTGNIMYNLWLTSIPDTVDNTGAIELMIRFWQNGMSQDPPVEVLTVPMKINGQEVQGKFNVNIGTTFSTPGGTVFSFVLDPMVQSGDVEVSLLFFAKYAVQKLGLDLDLYLQGVEFGTEFTQADQDYTFTLTWFNIQQTIGSSTMTNSITAASTTVATTTASTTTVTDTTSMPQPSIAYTSRLQHQYS